MMMMITNLLKLEFLCILLQIVTDTAVMDVGFALLLEVQIRECHQLFRKIGMKVSVDWRLRVSVPNAANFIRFLHNGEGGVSAGEEGQSVSPGGKSRRSSSHHQDLHLRTINSEERLGTLLSLLTR